MTGYGLRVVKGASRRTTRSRCSASSRTQWTARGFFVKVSASGSRKRACHRRDEAAAPSISTGGSPGRVLDLGIREGADRAGDPDRGDARRWRRRRRPTRAPARGGAIHGDVGGARRVAHASAGGASRPSSGSRRPTAFRRGDGRVAPLAGRRSPRRDARALCRGPRRIGFATPILATAGTAAAGRAARVPAPPLVAGGALAIPPRRRHPARRDGHGDASGRRGRFLAFGTHYLGLGELSCRHRRRDRRGASRAP